MTDNKKVATSLQTQDQRKLLDIVDKLRSQGISKYIDLPQIVVCGDQSSGKSSVLEAVSGLSFPAKDNRCTCFATELILRRGDERSLKVKLHSGQGTDATEKKRLESFSKNSSGDDIDLEDTVNEAKDFMGLTQGEGNPVFSDNVLRVEISGPDQPHLTIVDLPGLFEAGSRDQSEADAELVKSLVLSYMKKPRTIMLAVVSAKSDFNLQSVTKYARKLDPEGSRTLGLITKPDTLDKGSDMEASYLRLALNEDVKFRLGWHVVRNRDYATRNFSLKERDEQEQDFFAKGIWTSLGFEQKGVEQLRARLSRVLHDQILQQLPQVLRDIELGLDVVGQSLSRLGPDRTTIEQQKQYLLQARQNYSSTMNQAVGGIYSGLFFTTETQQGQSRRLRAILQNRLTKFSEEMRLHGQYWHIVEDEDQIEDEDQVEDENQVDKDHAISISKKDYISHVKTIVQNSRGRELPGTYNPMVVNELFIEQSQSWRSIIDKCIADVVDAAYRVVKDVVHHSTDRATAIELLKQISYPMTSTHEELKLKVAEICQTINSSHPITYNHYFTENISNAHIEAREKHLRKVLEKYTHNGQIIQKSSYGDHQYVTVDSIVAAMKNIDANPDMDLYASEEAMVAATAYYKVARKQIVDDIARIAVERTFMNKLDALFSLEFVCGLSNEQLLAIAGQNKAMRLERKQLQEKQDVLEEGLLQLRGLHSYQPVQAASADGSTSGGANVEE